jgi:hypothetical protein
MAHTGTFDERLNLVLDSHRLEELRSIAKREEMSLSAVVRRLIREGLERETRTEGAESSPSPIKPKGRLASDPSEKESTSRRATRATA